MSVQCGKGHRHATVAEVRACYQAGPAPAPVHPTRARTDGEHRYVRFTESAPTPAQIEAINRLGGVMPDGCTRGQASSIIGKLYAKRDGSPTPHLAQPKEPRVSKQFPFPATMLYGMHEARYAVSLDGSDNLTFLRVSVIKPFRSGRPRRHVGSIRLQTQHSEDLIDRFIVDPSGEYITLSNTMSVEKMSQLLAAVVVDQRGAAARYGRRLGVCCKCGKTLTDERSRWYGIGPECEKVWPEIIYESDEDRGVWQPSAQLVN